MKNMFDTIRRAASLICATVAFSGSAKAADSVSKVEASGALSDTNAMCYAHAILPVAGTDKIEQATLKVEHGITYVHVVGTREEGKKKGKASFIHVLTEDVRLGADTAVDFSSGEKAVFQLNGESAQGNQNNAKPTALINMYFADDARYETVSPGFEETFQVSIDLASGRWDYATLMQKHAGSDWDYAGFKGNYADVKQDGNFAVKEFEYSDKKKPPKPSYISYGFVPGKSKTSAQAGSEGGAIPELPDTWRMESRIAARMEALRDCLHAKIDLTP